MGDLHPSFRLWIYAEGRPGVFGDGKARLLRHIEQTGSLRQTADALGISYRKAWGDLKKCEACLNLPLIERTRGGSGGGRTLLTEDGRKVLAAFDRFHRRMKECVEREFAKLNL